MKERFKDLWNKTPLGTVVKVLACSAIIIAVFVGELFVIRAKGRTYEGEPSWEKGVPVTILCHYTTTETYRTAADRYIVTYGVFKAEENNHGIGEYFIAKFFTDEFTNIQSAEDGAELTLDYEQLYSEPFSLLSSGGYHIGDVYCSVENIPESEALELVRTYAERREE